MNFSKILILSSVIGASLPGMQSIAPKSIQTDRLYLRAMTLDDAEALIPILGDPEVMSGTKRPPMKTVDEIRDFLKTRILPSYQEENGWGRYAFIKKDTGELIGFGGLNKTAALTGREMMTLGIILAKKHQNQGYAREVTVAGLPLIRAAFPNLIAAIPTDNTRSIDLALKNGLRFSRQAIVSNELMSIYEVPDFQ